MTTTQRVLLFTISAAVFGFCAPASARADELILNGGFETGDFTGWLPVEKFTNDGNLFVSQDTVTPLSNLPTAGPASGSFYALTDMTGSGTYSLLQTFTVPVSASEVVLSFDMFVNDRNLTGGIINPIGLDHEDENGANQHVRVDILSVTALPFETGAGVLRNFYLGVDPGANPHPYSSYTFDITDLVGGGGTFQLRFAEVDNRGQLNMGVDNVSVQAVPEPTTMLLLGTGLAGIGGMIRRRRARQS